MAQYSFPFDSRLIDGLPDRPFNSADDRMRYGSLISNGIYANPSSNLQVVAIEGMKIGVQQGKAWVEGCFYYSNTMEQFTLDVADATNKRIDIVVLQFNLLERTTTLKVKKGTSSLSPTAPNLQRNSEVYELKLAEVLINPAIGNITQSVITDTRMKSEVCGVVTGLVDQVDTTTLFNQYDTQLSEKVIGLEEQFRVWFEGVKGILSEDVAGQLAIEIEQLKIKLLEIEQKNNAYDEKISTIEGEITSLKQMVRIINNFTLKKSEWVYEAGTKNYWYTVKDNFVTRDTVVDVNIFYTYAKDTSIKSSTLSSDGYWRMYSDEIPSTDLTVTVKMVKEVK